MIFGPAQKDVELGHGADYDGIEEYDNALPVWWIGLFYSCIAWALVYVVTYHFVGEISQVAAYEAEMAAAAERWPAPTTGAIIEVGDDGLAAGKAIYDANCVACHGAALEGGIGPNLTDDEWLHGNTRAEMVQTITNGVVAKGMPAWGSVLGPQKVAQVAAWIDEQS